VAQLRLFTPGRVNTMVVRNKNYEQKKKNTFIDLLAIVLNKAKTFCRRNSILFMKTIHYDAP
jgi:hypothetical protein